MTFVFFSAWTTLMIGFGDEYLIGVVCVFLTTWYSDGDQESVLYRQPTRGMGEPPK
jgi:hypothetical protein